MTIDPTFVSIRQLPVENESRNDRQSRGFFDSNWNKSKWIELNRCSKTQRFEHRTLIPTQWPGCPFSACVSNPVQSLKQCQVIITLIFVWKDLLHRTLEILVTRILNFHLHYHWLWKKLRLYLLLLSCNKVNCEYVISGGFYQELKNFNQLLEN